MILYYKNKEYIQNTIKEIENLPEKEFDKHSEEWAFCSITDYKKNYLDKEVTKRRLLKENPDFLKELKSQPNYFRLNLKSAINELIANNYIIFSDEKFSWNDNISRITLLRYLVDNYYHKKDKFNNNLSKKMFKNWVYEILKTLNHHFSKESVSKQIDSLI